MDGEVIRLVDITRYYKVGTEVVKALQEVSLVIRKNEFVALMGPSGSGKSTLMNLLGCLDTPTGGQYYLNGKDVSKLNDLELAEIRNKEIGFVFQTFNLLPRLTALDNVALPQIYAGISKAKRLERAQAVIENVGLTDRGHHKPNELSGGQRQRVAFASIISMETEMLIIDEPTSQLDPEGTEDVFEIIKTLKESNRTLIL
ncbi:MAG TPA: ABC transporter ATP-binding protein, partial [Bacteroidales bacterium]|nr:ABC transporter ATP-binding protein [Bacteroidales bacterium]